MPNMANITVKKADGTTDVTYTALVSAAGDKAAARWQNTALGSSPNLQPYLTVVSRFNGPRTVRRVDGEFGFQSTYVDSSTSQTVIKAIPGGTFSFTRPLEADDTAAAEAAAQFANLLASTLIKSVLASGYAPT